MSNASTPVRADLTAWVIVWTEAAGLHVGDAIAPADGGWDRPWNQEGARYQSYVVVTPGVSTIMSGPFSDSAADWQMTYTFAYYGISREQVENMADQARMALLASPRSTIVLGTDQWTVVQARAQQIGGVVRNDAYEPSQYSQIDSLSVWISKEL